VTLAGDLADYLNALIGKDEDTPEHRIGTCVRLLDDREPILEHLTVLMTINQPRSREFEVAQELWLLLGGTAVAA
jgi:hypothetical protein